MVYMIRKNRYTNITHIEDIDLYVDISIMRFRDLPIELFMRYYTSESDTISDKEICNIKNIITTHENIIDEIWSNEDNIL